MPRTVESIRKEIRALKKELDDLDCEATMIEERMLTIDDKIRKLQKEKNRILKREKKDG